MMSVPFVPKQTRCSARAGKFTSCKTSLVANKMLLVNFEKRMAIHNRAHVGIELGNMQVSVGLIEGQCLLRWFCKPCARRHDVLKEVV